MKLRSKQRTLIHTLLTIIVLSFLALSCGEAVKVKDTNVDDGASFSPSGQTDDRDKTTIDIGEENNEGPTTGPNQGNGNSGNDSNGNGIYDIGETVGDFTLLAHDGTYFRLSDLRGKKVLISLNPVSESIVCTIQMNDLEDRYSRFMERNTFSFGLNTDSVKTINDWADSLGLIDVLLLSDFNPKGDVSDSFGLYMKFTGTSNRANIIIDEQGVLIYKQKYGMLEQPDFDEVLDFLNGL